MLQYTTTAPTTAADVGGHVILWVPFHSFDGLSKTKEKLKEGEELWLLAVGHIPLDVMEFFIG